jgi:hypothetical protein
MIGEKRCIFCGSDQDCLHFLNTRPEFKGGVENFYYRCGGCRQYFVEHWINGELKMVRGS